MGAEIALDGGDRVGARALLDSARALARQQHEDYAAMAAGLEARLQAP